MKPIMNYSIICLIAVFLLSGCGKSDEQIKKLGVLQSELFQLQQQLLSRMSELNKVAWQIDAIANRRDKISTSMASEVRAAQELLTAASKATEDKGWQTFHRDDFDGMVKALEVNNGILRNAIDQDSIAISKSREVIDTFSKKEVQKKNIKK